MKSLLRLSPFLLLMSLLGCATLPAGPGVSMVPPSGKPFDLFRIEDADCRQWAEQQIGMSPQELANENTVSGAAVGTAIGAGIGGLLGAASGNVGAGAAFGAGTGLLFGSAVGSDNGRVYGQEAQRRYDNAYVQCMYSYGNQILQPGLVYRRRAVVYPSRGSYYYAPSYSPDYQPPPPNQPPPQMYPPETTPYPPPGTPPPDLTPRSKPADD